MRTVYMITQRAFHGPNEYEYQVPTDFGNDTKLFTLEREAEDALYKTERKYLKRGYHVIAADQTIKENGQHMSYRLEKADGNAIVLELWRKDVI